jgi:AcrR family transcriptional regulator
MIDRQSAFLENTTNWSCSLIAFSWCILTRQPTLRMHSRKQPKQVRSTELVAAILDAAVQVLATEDAQRFTTARVARRAGVSIGSLYQYFPNKTSILFRLQTDEWRRTSELLSDILRETARPAQERLRQAVATFIRSECEEARVRVALGDAEPFYRDAPEAQEAKASGALLFQTFMHELLPGAAKAERLLTAELIEITMTQVGKKFSEQLRSAREIERFAKAMGDMFCAYIERLQNDKRLSKR